MDSHAAGLAKKKRPASGPLGKSGWGFKTRGLLGERPLGVRAPLGEEALTGLERSEFQGDRRLHRVDTGGRPQRRPDRLRRVNLRRGC